MSDQQRDPRTELDEVMVPEEDATPDHREHAKEAHPPDDEALERRVQHERERTGAGGPVRDEN